VSRCGDVYQNSVTGEYCVVLRGTEDRGDGPGIVHLVARPGAAVVGEHIHPMIEERFKVISGRLSATVGDARLELEAGEEAVVSAGVAHDWWNASDTEEAHVVVELRETVPGSDPVRFELLIGTLFGLANDGKVDRKGRPKPLQAAVIAKEFDDVVRFTKPPRPVQRVLIALLAPLGRLRGYRGAYPEYSHPHARTEPDPRALAAAGLDPRDRKG
jgi:mannose-6-phosphate isomerase-like protein (cupin superfamily)